MTVAKLIEILQLMPQEAEVKTFDPEWGCFYNVNPEYTTPDNDAWRSDRLQKGDAGIVVL